MSKNNPIRVFLNGMFTENPVFVLMLGICPALAVTTSALKGLGMGLTTTIVLVLSSLLISIFRKLIPEGVRIPVYIIIVGTFVTAIQLLMEGYIPELYDSLGIYIPLIVVNCIILGRIEAYASKHNVFLAFFDGLGMGLGFTLALTFIGVVREFIGAGKVFGYTVLPSSYEPLTIFIIAPGAFFILAFITAIINKFRIRGGKSEKVLDCDSLCEHCGVEGCLNRVAPETNEELDIEFMEAGGEQ